MRLRLLCEMQRGQSATVCSGGSDCAYVFCVIQLGQSATVCSVGGDCAYGFLCDT
eukprot:COSAG05_NODE_5571_length_1138_cov_0.899904_2_plen_54_part_01